VTGAKRPVNEWYSPYFAPTTVFIAVTVLVISVQAGKYTGNYFIQRDKAASLTAPLNVVPAQHAVPTKAAAHTSPAKAGHSTSGKTRH
jgi:hypothetical protein